MKKWISLLLAGTMAMGLAACGTDCLQQHCGCGVLLHLRLPRRRLLPKRLPLPLLRRVRLSGKIATGGSTSVEKVINALMEGYAELAARRTDHL